LGQTDQTATGVAALTENLVNNTNDVQTVSYTFTPHIRPGDGGSECTGGIPVTVTIKINPQPKIAVTTNPVLCFNENARFNLSTVNTVISTGGQWRYDVEITYPADVTGTYGGPGATVTVPNLTLIGIASFIDAPINTSDGVRTLSYKFTPHIRPGDGGPDCQNGIPVTLTININPQPRIFPIPLNTTQCDKTTTSIQLQSPSTFTAGAISFDYTVTPNSGVTGYSTTPVTGLGNNSKITDNLVNSTDHFQIVTYRVIPVSPTGCAPGQYRDISVTVNPTPKVIPNNLVPAICYTGTTLAPVNTQIVLNSPTVMAPGWGNVRFDYTVSVTGGAGIVVGNTESKVDLIPGSIINFTYQNNSPDLQTVNYLIIPKVDNAICDPGPGVSSSVVVHPKPLQNIIVTNPLSCEGRSDAALRAVISNGSDPYHEVWDGVARYHKVDLLDIDNLSGGWYVIKVTDSLNCNNKDSVFVNSTKVYPYIYADVIPPGNYNISCPSSTDGRIQVAVSSGVTSPYIYSLVKNDTEILYTGTFYSLFNFLDPTTYEYYNNLGAGSYKLIIDDANGCEYSNRIVMKVPPPMVATFIKSQYNGGYNISCKGYNNGSISIQSIAGGRPGSHLYNWSTTDGFIPGNTTLDHIDNLIAGTYTVEIRDVLNCSQFQSTTITEPDGMQFAGYQLSKSPDGNFNVSCNGGNDGTISMTITGGSGNYVYSWTGPAGFTSTTKDLTGLKAGYYTCTISDLNGCNLASSPSFTLTEPAPLMFSSFTTSMSTDGTHNINCYGSNTGWISLTVTGGSTGSYTYNWSTTDGTGIVEGAKDQTSLTAGTYHLSVTDANKCVLTRDITLTQPSEFNSQLTATNITCKSPGFNNGSILLVATGGTTPYSYLWSNGSTSKDVTGLTEGNYKVIITDINGCIKTDSAKIELPPALSYTKNVPELNGYNISCNGLSDGSINVDLISGAPPYNYTWTGPNGFTGTTKSISGLKAGQYHLLIIDNNECKASEVIDLTEPGILNMNFTLSSSIAGGYNINCAGDNTGSIDVIAVNQVKTVDYLWADGIFGKTRTNLPAGIYSIIITDANNCHASSTVTLTAPDSIKNVFDLTLPFCPDKPDGRIDAKVTGGVKVSDYYYRWSDNSTNKSLLNIPEGLYKLTISDLNGCSIRDSVLVNPQNEACLIIPNAISPNGDLINDVWNIGMKELYPNMEVKIFNRWGESIWKSARGYPEPWDGTSNGYSLPIDSYIYIIDLHNGSKPIVGNITIVR
jgi:gliding motility-associated-like protein